GGRVTDLVVVLDRIAGFARGTLAVGAATDLQKLRIEKALLGQRMGVEQSPEPCPDRRHRVAITGPKFVDQYEQPPLLDMIVRDQLRDIHAWLLPTQPQRLTPV